MKVKKLTIKNVGKIADVSIELNKPLVLFYGEIKQGKTTILNAVRWVCGGEFPQDIIQHGKQEASVELEFDGGLISRSWYRSKDGPTKARPVVFVRGGKPVSSPVSEIKRLLNPFLLDQDFLRNKTELERKQFFTELFAVDTSELDAELFNSQRDAQVLRVKISGYGEIDLTPAEPVDSSKLKSELAAIRDAHANELAKVTERNDAAKAHNSTVDRGAETLSLLSGEIAELEVKLSALKEKQSKTKAWLTANPKREILPTPTPPNTAELEDKIQEAGAANVRAENYRKNKERDEARKADEKALRELERRQREIKAEKQAKLKTVSDSCGIDGLSFDDSGNFIYQGTTAGMISDSQIMRLSSELSALYPEGFGLDLVDRGESLGRSIFEFVERAKREEKTILATVVGERPASVPENIGVFVVENGGVK